jgi:hypothetical protein
MVVSGCAQPDTTANSGTTGRPVGAVQSADAGNPATVPGSGATTVAVHASCPTKGYPFVSLLTGVNNWTTALGKVIHPGAPEVSKVVAESDAGPAMIYGEFDAAISQVLTGPRLEQHVSLSFPGGKTDEIVTDIGKGSQSAWAEDGSFIGLFRADTEAPTGWIADVLPVIEGRVVFPDGVGCFEPAGLRDVDKRAVSVLVFDNGTVIELSGLFPTASLDEITRKLAQ